MLVHCHLYGSRPDIHQRNRRNEALLFCWPCLRCIATRCPPSRSAEKDGELASESLSRMGGVFQTTLAMRGILSCLLIFFIIQDICVLHISLVESITSSICTWFGITAKRRLWFSIYNKQFLQNLHVYVQGFPIHLFQSRIPPPLWHPPDHIHTSIRTRFPLQWIVKQAMFLSHRFQEVLLPMAKGIMNLLHFLLVIHLLIGYDSSLFSSYPC